MRNVFAATIVLLAGACSARQPAATSRPLAGSPPVATAPLDSAAPVKAEERSAPIAAEEPDEPAAQVDERDTNVPGTTLLRGSVFVDRSPPRGWKQCAGFKNTAGDDVAPEFLDHCLNTTRLRVRVFFRNEIEEDVYVVGIGPTPVWPAHNYLAGMETRSVIVKATHWGTMEGQPSSAFFVGEKGKDACGRLVSKSGMTFGSGHAEKAIVAPGATGYDEYRLSCGREPLPDREIAFYR